MSSETFSGLTEVVISLRKLTSEFKDLRKEFEDFKKQLPSSIESSNNAITVSEG